MAGFGLRGGGSEPSPPGLRSVTPGQRQAPPGCRRGKRRARPRRPLAPETTNFGVFQGSRRLGGGCPAGGGLSHCETRLLFLRLPLPAAPEPRGARETAPTVSRGRGTPGPGTPRPSDTTISGSPGQGTAASSSLRRGCLPAQTPAAPNRLPRDNRERGGSHGLAPPIPTPLFFHQAPIHALGLAGKTLKHRISSQCLRALPKLSPLPVTKQNTLRLKLILPLFSAEKR